MIKMDFDSVPIRNTCPHLNAPQRVEKGGNIFWEVY